MRKFLTQWLMLTAAVMAIILMLSSGCALKNAEGVPLDSVESARVYDEQLMGMCKGIIDAYNVAYDEFPQHRDYLVEKVRPALKTAKMLVEQYHKLVMAWDAGEEPDADLSDIYSRSMQHLVELMKIMTDMGVIENE